MSTFSIVVGTSTIDPVHAKNDAEAKAIAAGGEQISIAACVLGGAPPPDMTILDNIAKNIYQLVQCTCPTVVGAEIHKPGTPPPIPVVPLGGLPAAAGPLWVVYILLKH